MRRTIPEKRYEHVLFTSAGEVILSPSEQVFVH